MLWLEALVTVLVGGGTWLISQELLGSSNAEAQSAAVVLSFLVGGMTFLVQRLTLFDRRVWRLELEQERRLAHVEELVEQSKATQDLHERSVRDRLDDHFAKVSRASNLYALMEGSPFGSEIFEELGHHANGVGPETPYLLRNLIGQELRRLSDTVRQVGGNQGVWYEGEDREWLLALATSTQATIDAVSLPIADGGSRGFDDGFWTSDFGERYLEEQYNGITRRGVRVRRIFVYDQADPDDALLAIKQRQVIKQVEVRLLRWWGIPQERHVDVSDFIVLDGKLLYELSPARVGHRLDVGTSGHLARATRLRTHLDADAHVLDTKQGLFEFLWSLAGDSCAAADRSVPELVGHPDDRSADGPGPERDVTRAEDLRSLEDGLRPD
jgi:hypothetical protein